MGTEFLLVPKAVPKQNGSNYYNFYLIPKLGRTNIGFPAKIQDFQLSMNFRYIMNLFAAASNAPKYYMGPTYTKMHLFI